MCRLSEALLGLQPPLPTQLLPYYISYMMDLCQDITDVRGIITVCTLGYLLSDDCLHYHYLCPRICVLVGVTGAQFLWILFGSNG